MELNAITLHVNGKQYEFSIGNKFGQIPCSETLTQTLRERLGLTGTKKSCDEGACGCCTVIMDGDAVTSCMLLTVDCDGRHITTIEGLQNPQTGELDPLQQAFIDEYAFQCGYCTPALSWRPKRSWTRILIRPKKRSRMRSPAISAAASASIMCSTLSPG
jgi:carbon-monoxide dehydrogenase small subunit